MKKELLADLLHPIHPNDFFKYFYEKKHLLIKDRHSDFYKDILTVKDIDSALELGHIPPEAIKIVKNTPLPPQEWTSMTNHGISINVSKIFDNLRKDNSLLFVFLNKYIIKLQRFVQQFKANIISNAWTNVYITPPNAQAFEQHYDTHDVLVLQIKGTKHWKLYDSPIEYPNTNIPYSKANITSNAKSPTHDFILNEGDLLYIPRGLMHEALTTDNTSIHITLGFSVPQMKHTIQYLSEVISSDPFFRRSITAISNDENHLEVAEKAFKDQLHQFINKMSFEDLLSKTQQSFIQNNYATKLNNQLADFLDDSKVNENTLIGQRQDCIYSIRQEGHFVHINYNERTEKFPFFLKTTIESIFKKDIIQIKNIETPLNINDTIKLVNQLIQKGLVVMKNKEYS